MRSLFCGAEPTPARGRPRRRCAPSRAEGRRGGRRPWPRHQGNWRLRPPGGPGSGRRRTGRSGGQRTRSGSRRGPLGLPPGHQPRVAPAYLEQLREMERLILHCERQVVERRRAEADRADEWWKTRELQGSWSAVLDRRCCLQLPAAATCFWLAPRAFEPFDTAGRYLIDAPLLSLHARFRHGSAGRRGSPVVPLTPIPSRQMDPLAGASAPADGRASNMAEDLGQTSMRSPPPLPLPFFTAFASASLQQLPFLHHPGASSLSS